VLFERLDASVITDLLNQFFQELCAIALRHGAVVDQYIGDGVLLIFNIDQDQKKHETAALKAAEEMRSAFRNLKQRWITLGYDGTDVLFVRFGLSSGEVTRAEIGHAHARRVTVIGPPVNAAAYACEGGPRSHDTICITHEMREALAIDIKTSKDPINTKRATVFEVIE
jgi:class 3 adenylate cyclase